MTVRMQDIADQLGLSVSTVSLALRSAPQIAEQTKVRVHETAERLGYTHRARHAALAGLSHIAFMTYMGPNNEFYGGVLSGAESECRRSHITLHYQRIETDTPTSPAPPIRADGLLIVGNMGAHTISPLHSQRLNSVLIDNNPSTLPIDRVLIDNSQSVYAAMIYLYQLGHRQIAYISGPLTHSSFHERREGYLAAMQALNLTPFEIPCMNLDPQEIAQAVVPHIGPDSTLPFTAVMTCNDLVAINTMYVLRERGIDVPGRVSVIGFDDIDMATVVRPALTTCRVDRELLGMLGVRRLIERAKHPEQAIVTVTIATTLVERGSTSIPYSQSSL